MFLVANTRLYLTLSVTTWIASHLCIISPAQTAATALPCTRPSFFCFVLLWKFCYVVSAYDSKTRYVCRSFGRTPLAFCRLLYYCSSPYALVFLVACYATLQPALSVRPSVRRSVRPSHFTFFGFLRSLASLLLPKWSSDLKYGPCPLSARTRNELTWNDCLQLW